MKRIAIIVAGGTGTRMNADVPKQFMLLNGKPVLMHSIEKFHLAGAFIIVVLHENLIEMWRLHCTQYNFVIPHLVTGGGTTRGDSVYKGLMHAATMHEKPGAMVAIHDAARPLVSVILIEKLFNECSIKGNAVPAIKIVDSLRRVTSSGNEPVDRSELVMIQTPQCFYFDKLVEAYKNTANHNYTDDATLFETMGNRINLVEGESNNFKITVETDLVKAEALLKD